MGNRCCRSLVVRSKIPSVLMRLTLFSIDEQCSQSKIQKRLHTAYSLICRFIQCGLLKKGAAGPLRCTGESDSIRKRDGEVIMKMSPISSGSELENYSLFLLVLFIVVSAIITLCCQSNF